MHNERAKEFSRLTWWANTHQHLESVRNCWIIKINEMIFSTHDLRGRIFNSGEATSH